MKNKELFLIYDDFNIKEIAEEILDIFEFQITLKEIEFILDIEHLAKYT